MPTDHRLPIDVAAIAVPVAVYWAWICVPFVLSFVFIDGWCLTEWWFYQELRNSYGKWQNGGSRTTVLSMTRMVLLPRISLVYLAQNSYILVFQNLYIYVNKYIYICQLGYACLAGVPKNSNAVVLSQDTAELFWISSDWPCSHD